MYKWIIKNTKPISFVYLVLSLFYLAIYVWFLFLSTDTIQGLLKGPDNGYEGNGAGVLILFLMALAIFAKASLYFSCFFALTRCILHIVGIAAKKPILIIISCFSLFLESGWKFAPIIIGKLAGEVLGIVAYIIFFVLTVFSLVYAIMLIVAQKRSADLARQNSVQEGGLL